MKRVKKLLRDNGLALCMFGLFATFLVGLSITGYLQNNEEQSAHNQSRETYSTYIASGTFVEAVFENWESEFLQMAALVIATVFLRQKGSVDSKKLHGKAAVDTSSRYSIIHASSSRKRGKAIKSLLLSNSLGLALLALFVISFVLHAIGGASAYNHEAQLHGASRMTITQYIGSAQFWFEAFQNWQSEFLAVGSLLVLSIYLRQRGSPESKPIGTSNQATGE